MRKRRVRKHQCVVRAIQRVCLAASAARGRALMRQPVLRVWERTLVLQSMFKVRGATLVLQPVFKV